jgi:hypothetical protein
LRLCFSLFKTKQNKNKENKQTKTKQNKTKQNKTSKTNKTKNKKNKKFHQLSFQIDANDCSSRQQADVRSEDRLKATQTLETVCNILM